MPMPTPSQNVQAVSSVTEVSGAQSSSFGTATTGDVNQFQEHLNSSGAAKVKASSAEKSHGAQGTFYEKILNPLKEFRANFDKIIGNIGGIVGRGDLGMKDLMQIQFQLTQLSYMNDLSAKTADKLSQGIQTLFRNQG
jgi:hypothetical protein